MSNAFKKSLGELLIDNEIIDKQSLDDAIALQVKSGKKLGKILQEMGVLDESTLYRFLEEQLNIVFSQSIEGEPDPELFSILPLRYCRSKVIAPVSSNPNSIKIMVSEPTNTAMINEVSFMSGKVVEIDFATEGAIMEFLDQVSTIHRGGAAALSEHNAPPQREEKPKEMKEDDSPVVRYVEQSLHNGIERGVSDIHFEVYENYAVLRYRIDGVLHKVEEIDLRMYPAIISRVKILAELDISEKRLPQDGRIMTHYQERQIDIRVSIIPTVYGEGAVLRILDKGKSIRTLDEIEFSEEMRQVIKREAKKPFGMVLVTGPTGSGKTTTLYAVLQYVLQFENKILTIEDPVEYQMNGVAQVQVHTEIGLSFAAGLRSFLRHDPDVIMVGEIRDRETAEIAVRAALTGHLVLSTVHTNDSASTLTRFIDMGIPPYLLTSTINLVLAQRLVRKICPKCRTEQTLTKEDIELYGIGEDFNPGDKVYYGKGCKACNKTGYSGRAAIFELLQMTESIKKAVLRGESSFEIKALASQEGMEMLRDSGIAMVKNKITTLEEIEKIVSLGE